MRQHEAQRIDTTYPGGKAGSGVVQRLINRMPPHDVYIAPFLGRDAVMCKKRPALRNIGVDLDPDVIAWWRDAPPFVIEQLCSAAPSPLAQAAAAAECDVRRRPARSLATSDSATLPATSPKSPAVDRADPAARKRGVRSPGPDACSSVCESGGAGLQFDFRCGDGIEFLRNYSWTGRELVYCDPPYLHETRRDLKLYAYEMSAAQHRDLLQVICTIPAAVMISGYRCSLYREHLERRGWFATDYRTMTRRGPVSEMLWCNFAEPVELHDYSYLGENRRERERVRRQQRRWTARLAGMDRLQRQALLAALASAGGLSGGTMSFASSISPGDTSPGIQFRPLPSIASSDFLLNQGLD